MKSPPDESGRPIIQLLEAARGSLPPGATIAVGGEWAPVRQELPWDLLPFGASSPEAAVDEDARPRDSAGAIVALERGRTRGVSFLALPDPTNHWLDELLLFANHCRARYSVVLESELGIVFDLRLAVEAESAQGTAALAEGEISDRGGHEGDADGGGGDGLDALASTLSRLVRGGDYSGENFRRFERHGVHVTPVHFYSPIPDTLHLGNETWQRESELIGIDMNLGTQLHLVDDVFPQFRAEYEGLPTSPSADEPSQFYFGNGLFDGTDALVLYCMLRHLEPRRMVEVGSGFSTRLAAQAALANGSTEIVCIDPFPDALVQEGFPGLTTLITSRVEELSLDVFTELEENDVLFVDSSHVVRTGGDVTYLFLEVLPRLQPGVVVQVHDVFLPHEYPRDWVVDWLRFWNEQYLLQAFLAFNSAFAVLVANSYLEAKHPDALRNTFPTSPWWGGGSIWLRRSAE